MMAEYSTLVLFIIAAQSLFLSSSPPALVERKYTGVGFAREREDQPCAFSFTLTSSGKSIHMRKRRREELPRKREIFSTVGRSISYRQAKGIQTDPLRRFL